MMIDIERFNKVAPTSEEALRRLSFLLEQAKDVRVAVFGKYNHGKSTLLNAIIGQEVFKAADKRETTEISEYQHNGVIWVDTPGLDADVHGEDDRKAREGAFAVADFLFLVHSVKTGELDKYETQLYRDLMKQDKNYRKKMFLILTQIDQVEKSDLEQVLAKITNQFPELEIFPVSAIRYMKGVAENTPVFIEKSGFNQLVNLVERLKSDIESMRAYEKKRLINKVKVALAEKQTTVENALASLAHNIAQLRKNFDQDLNAYIKQVQEKAKA